MATILAFLRLKCAASADLGPDFAGQSEA